MPYRRLPNSMPSVIRTLETARDRWLITTDPAERAITAEQFAQLDTTDPTSLLSRLLKETSDLDQAKAAQTPLTTAFADAMAPLVIHVSHFHQVLDLAIGRGKYEPGIRALFGRAANSTVIPDLSSADEVKAAAEKIVAAEPAHTGYTGVGAAIPMENPSGAEIAPLLAAFNAARNPHEESLTTTDLEREDLAALYPEALALAIDIVETVEFFYRKDKIPSSFRAKTRRWGVVYVFAPGETPDPEDPDLPPYTGSSSSSSGSSSSSSSTPSSSSSSEPSGSSGSSE